MLNCFLHTLSLTLDEDFRPVSDGSYMYEIEFSENQQTRVALPIEIINDLAAEQDESFILSLSPGPDAATLNYQIPSSGRIVTVLITDNDRKSLCSQKSFNVSILNTPHPYSQVLRLDLTMQCTVSLKELIPQ